MKQNGVCNLQENFGKWTTNLVLRVREKGSERINSVSQQLNVDIVTHPEQTVHQICRRDHCHHKDIRRQERNPVLKDAIPKIRSQANAFSFKEQCLFCTKQIKREGNKRGFDSFPVRTFDFQLKIQNVCNDRKNDFAS